MEPHTLAEVEAMTDKAFYDALSLAISLATQGEGTRAFVLAGGVQVVLELVGRWNARRSTLFRMVEGIVPFPGLGVELPPMVATTIEEGDAFAKVVAFATSEVYLAEGAEAGDRAWWAVYPTSEPPWRMSPERRNDALAGQGRPH